MMPAHHHRHAGAAILCRDLIGAARREGLDRHGDEVGRHHAHGSIRSSIMVVAMVLGVRALRIANTSGVMASAEEAFAERGPQEGDVSHQRTAIST